MSIIEIKALNVIIFMKCVMFLKIRNTISALSFFYTILRFYITPLVDGNSYL